MSDIFFTDTSEVPVPPPEVRIRGLVARPRPDGVRVDVHLELTPFQKRPNVEVAITDSVGNQVAALSVVETVDRKMDFTMHLREPQPGGSYKLGVQVFYSNVEGQVPSNAGKLAGEILRKAKTVVDQRQIEFASS